MRNMIKLLFKVADTDTKYIKKMFLYRFFYSISVGFVIAGILYFLITVTNEIFYNEPITMFDVYVVFGIMLISFILRVIFMYFSLINKAICQFNITAKKRLEIGDRLKNVNMGFFSENRLGEIVSELTTVLSDFEALGLKFFEEMFGGFIQTIIMAIGIMFFDFITGIIIIVTLLLSLLVNALFQHKADKINKKLHMLRINLNADILEYVQGIAVIKSFGKGKDRFRKLESSILDTASEFFNQEKSFSVAHFLFTGVLKLGAFSVIFTSVYRYTRGNLDATHSLLLIMMSFIAFDGFEMMLTILNIKQMTLIGLEKVISLQNIKTIDSGKLKEITVPNITFNNVCFRYLDENDLLFDNLSLDIPEYKTTAIVGSSGSGKTTILSLMARFFDVESGEILLNGIDIKKYDYDYLLSMFSFVFQDVYLFDDTIKNNIKFGFDSATDGEVIEVSKKARCHDFIMKLEEGYNSKLNEGGSNLSGGEKQRISIARAMLKPSKFVILDEATSSVDPENEEELILALDELSKNKTVITIAHRIKTIRNADQLIVMDKGKIVGRGTHSTLINKDGLYKSFIQSRKMSSNWKIVK